MTTLWAAMRDVALPRGCAGCDAPDAVLCPECRALFAGAVAFPAPRTAMGEGFACAPYRGAVRRAVLGWKDHGDEECDGVFAELLGALAVGVLDRHAVSATGAGPYASAAGRVGDPVARRAAERGPRSDRGRSPLLVVPAPSSASSMRRRGRWHMRTLARAVARRLRDYGTPAVMAPALRSVHVRGRSVETATAAERAARVGGRVAVRPGMALRGRDVVVVDDIVTTGATVRQCCAALRRAGARVVTCLALARTPEPGRDSSSA